MGWWPCQTKVIGHLFQFTVSQFHNLTPPTTKGHPLNRSSAIALPSKAAASDLEILLVLEASFKRCCI